MSEVLEVRDAATRDALRTEHDALARRLAIRTSVDAVRKALYLVFLGLLSVGLAVKLAFDRWGVLRPGVARKLHPGPPLFLWVAMGVALVLLALSIRYFLQARTLMREEDACYARYRTLRTALGLDT
jgi:heme exporter protein D